MREAMFIKKNVEKWESYQHEQAVSPDETADRFITLIDDLSYAKTFYPKSKVTRWINGLTASMYQNVYRNKRQKFSRLFEFWKFELPLLFRKYHPVFLFTVLLFCFFVFIGLYAAALNPEFIRSILGDNYVNHTEENIANGDPFGIYKDDNYFNMFVRIAFNNIKVAFITFLGGLSLGIFTFKILWDNGLMLGSFEYLFFEHGLGLQSILVIWIHGVIEISSIVIAGTAGFILARGFLFPGTYSRLESFRRAASDAAKIMICLVPFFIIAAFLESYVTHLMSTTFDASHSAGLPVWASIIILATSLFLIVWYFIIWPRKLHSKGYYIKKNGIVNRLLDGE